MKKLFTVLAGASCALLAATGAQAASPEKGEAKLAKMLEGRVAGEPRSCISAFSDHRLEVIDRVGVVYDAGDTVWVARPADPRSLDTSDILIMKRTGGSLCKQDVTHTIDRTLGHTTSVVFLGDFVPFTKAG